MTYDCNLMTAAEEADLERRMAEENAMTEEQHIDKALEWFGVRDYTNLSLEEKRDLLSNYESGWINATGGAR
jgi:hypothetical protein